MVTRQAAAVKRTGTIQAVRDVRVSLDHSQRMRNSGSDSNSNSGSAWTGTVAWELRLRYRARLYAGAMHRPTRLVRPPQVAR
jgi:hypothetical protein